MEEFRPAQVIEADTELAERLIGGELGALDELVERYARPVVALVAARSGAHPTAVDVFARAWISRDELTPGDDFSPWIGAIAADGLDDADRLWTVASAVGAIDADAAEMLRGHHVEGALLAEGLDRDELRLRRRLAHLGDDTAIIEALSQAIVWTQPPEGLAADVRAAIEGPARAAVNSHEVDSSVSAGNDGAAPEQAERAEPSRVTRSLRPVLFGLAGAVTVLFVAIIALSAASGSPDPVAFSADLTPTGALTEVEGGELTATVRDAGIEFSLDAPTLPTRTGGRYYEGLLVLRDGTELGVGTFAAAFDITLWGGVALDDVVEFQVVAREVGIEVSDVVLKLDVPRS